MKLFARVTEHGAFKSAPFLFREQLYGDGPMAVPKRKVTKSKRGMRRSHDQLSSPAYVEDQDTGELKRPHHIDLKTGIYRGRQVTEPKE